MSGSPGSSGGLNNPIVSIDDVQEDVLAIGILIGLLSKDDDSYTVNLDWFDDPSKYLQAIDRHVDRLIFLLNKYVGPPVKNPPPLPDGVQWYQLPYPGSEEKSPIYVVSPGPDKSKGDLGLGFLYNYPADQSKEDFSVKIYTYLKLFAYGSSGTKTVANDYPCHIGFAFTSKSSPLDGDVYGMNVDSTIHLSDATPSFEFALLDKNGKVIKPVYTRVQDLINAAKDKLIAAAVKKIGSWLDKTTVSESKIPVGDILVSSGLLSRDKSKNYLFSLEQIKKLTPGDFIFGVLNVFAGSKKPASICKLPGGGLYLLMRPNKSDGSVDYGLRLAFDIALPVTTSSDGTPTRQFTLSSGSWLKGEDGTKNWMNQSKTGQTDFPDPGIVLYLLNTTSKKTQSFSPQFLLSSVGFDIAGANQTSLFSSGGYSMQGAQLRGSYDFSKKTWGAACKLNSLTLPLGTAIGSASDGAGTNAVAKNLLASGSKSKGGDKDPVNPPFSISTAYLTGGSLKVQLYDKDGKPADVVLVPINRALGPLQCDRLGIGWVSSKKEISLLFDGRVQLGALSIALQGLSVGIPANSPADFSKYDLDLNGMGVTFAESDIEVSGTLVKVPADPKSTPPRDYVQYNGAALVKGGAFTISALGSYAFVRDRDSTDGYTSFFVFGMHIGDLGGPAFFYVTGIAAGFGYNRGIRLPDQNGVPKFPLVAAVNDPTVLGAKKLPDGSWKAPDPATALSKIGDVVPPQRGQYWFAAGVRFTSFDLVNSSALLVVEFGNQLEISLLGLSWMSLPPPATPGAPAPTQRYAYVELGLQVKFVPSDGFLGATAILSSNSYLIDPDCKLTGGFAFYTWFGDNPHAGEFVLTIGGYHPDFDVPDYYPDVPRLAFNWNVSDEVTVSGDAYFALTPSAVMAGAGLQILFSRGDLKAWFRAQMDALIVWAPFHYVIDISVNIGASYRANLLFVTTTVSVELSANLTIWGPRMGGSVYIDWYIISFTISFGADRNEAANTLDWTNDGGTGFAQTLLPHRTGSPRLLTGAPISSEDGSVQPDGIFTITVNSGLLTTINKKTGETVWIVRPNNFAFAVKTEIPTTEIDITLVDGKNVQKYLASAVSPDGGNYFLCVRPMKATLRSSVATISLKSDDGSVTFDLNGRFLFDMALSRVPAAKWGKPIPGNENPEENALLDGRLMGLENVTPRDPVLTPQGDGALKIDIATAYKYDVVDDESPYTPEHLPLDTSAAPAGVAPVVDGGAIQKIQSSLMKTAVKTRNEIFVALQEFGVNALTNGKLDGFAANPAAVLTGNPFIIIQEPGRSIAD